MESMFNIITKLLVFAIPPAIAAILHMVVVKINLFPALKYPLDCYKTINTKRLFGNSKTFRGVVFMIVFSIIASYFLFWLTNISYEINRLNIIDFGSYSPLIIGAAFGAGYVLAELPNSFFKRMIGIEEGKRGSFINVMIDQADSPIGCMLAVWAFSDMSLELFIAGSVFYLFLHMFFNVLLYLVGLRKNLL